MMEDTEEPVLQRNYTGKPRRDFDSYWKRFVEKPFQSVLDRWTRHTIKRWVVTVVLTCLFDLRIYLLQGWYIPCYALKIYHLNLFLAFLTPKIDPAIAAAAEENAEDDGLELPTRHNDEFRPFTRRLPEWIFWKKATRAIFIMFPFTCFKIFDWEVFWPFLVVYFIVLTCVTLKRHIKHMIRYRYVPFTWGKPKYAKVEEEDQSATSTPPSNGVAQQV